MCGDDYPSPAKRRRLSYGLQNAGQPVTVAPSRSGGNPPVEYSTSDKSNDESSSYNSASLTMAPFLKEHIQSKYQGQGLRPRPASTAGGKDQRPYCYRHRPDLKCRKQPSEPDMEQLQSDLQSLSQTDQQNISNVWTIFSAAPARHREMMLQGILAQCCFPQLSFLLSNVRDMIKIDFLSALPTEIGLLVMRNLDTTSLCKAAQVSRQWRALADSDDVWHRMCEQHIARKCKKCGWGLPLLERKRLMASKHQYQRRAAGKDIESGPDVSDSDGSHAPAPKDNQAVAVKKYRPWKEVYKDRFEIGSNWKHGRYTARVFKGHTNGVLCLQFNDHVLATGSYDNTIKIWDVATGKEIRTLRGHECGVRCLQFDDSKLISGSLDCTIKVWNWNTGECLRTLTGHGGGVLGLHFYDRVLVSGSVDHTVNIWDFEGGSRTCLRGHSDWVNSVKVDTASRTVFSASDDLTVRLWDLDTGRTIRTFEGHVGHVQEVLPLSEDFDFETPEGEPIEDHGHDADPADDATYRSSAFATAFANGRTLPPRYMLTSGLDSTIRLWDVHTGRCVRTSFGHVEGIWAIAADPMRIVSGAEDRMLKIWDSRTGRCERTITWHGGPVTSVALNDSRIASGSEDGDVRMLSFNYFRRAGVLAHDCPT